MNRFIRRSNKLTSISFNQSLWSENHPHSRVGKVSDVQEKNICATDTAEPMASSTAIVTLSFGADAIGH